MTVIKSTLKPRAKDFKENAAALVELVSDLREDGNGVPRRFAGVAGTACRAGEVAGARAGAGVVRSGGAVSGAVAPRGL